MESRFIRRLSSRCGEWFPLYDLENDPKVFHIKTIWRMIDEYDGIMARLSGKTLFIRFSLEESDVPEPPLLPDTPDNQDLIIEALLEWDYSAYGIPPVDLSSIYDPKTGDTWLHLLAKKGVTYVFERWDEDKLISGVTIHNHAGKTPLDVATGHFLHLKTSQACQRQKQELRETVTELEERSHAIINELTEFTSRIRKTRAIAGASPPTFSVFMIGFVMGIVFEFGVLALLGHGIECFP